MKKFLYPGIILSLLLITVLSGWVKFGATGNLNFIPGIRIFSS